MGIFIILMTVIVLLAVLALISEFFLRFALSSSFDNTKKLDETTGYEVDDDVRNEEEKSRIFLSKCSDVYIKSKDGLTLHAYLYKGESNKFLLTIHGYKGKATNNGILYRALAEEGYSILVLDVRGHGKSEGKWLSMGLWEKEDTLLWIEYIRKTNPDALIALHGVSMGASTVMMASGSNPEGVKAAIEDCGYSSLYDEFSCQLKALFHLPPHPLLDIISLWCRIRLGLSFSSIRPVDAVKKTTIPMLFIHGSEDTFVPTWMVYPCYENHRGPKELWIAKESVHARCMDEYKDEYNEKCFSFVERFM